MFALGSLPKPFNDMTNKQLTPITLPTKSQVNKAGEILRKEPHGPASSGALEILSQWRSAHSYVLNTFQALIRKKCHDLHFRDALVAQRLKRLESIRYKLERFSGRLSTIQDIAGIRVILPTMQQVNDFYGSLIKSRIQHVPKCAPKNYIAEPKKDGYRSIHQVYSYSNTNRPELEGLFIEVQIRTRLQHAWATAVETLGVIEHSAFKSGVGDESFKRFFKLSSALFSLDEKTPVLEEFKDVAPAELVAQFENLESELNVFKKLTGVTIAAKRILTSSKNAYYQLMILDVEQGTLALNPFKREEAVEAEQRYTSLEARHDPNLMVVLVSAGDLKNIQKAYPNYFLDAKVFMTELKRICAAIKAPN